LNQYRRLKSEKQKQNEFLCTDHFITSVEDYFNATLVTQLLYSVERNQYETIQESHLNDEVQPADIYGISHLLRLISLLGKFLSYSPLEENEVDYLLGYINDFMKYLDKNIKLWFHVEDNYRDRSSLI